MIEMSRIATYKALADKISGIAGLVAYTSSETSATGGNDDVLEMTDTFAPSTKLKDMYKRYYSNKIIDSRNRVYSIRSSRSIKVIL